MPAPSEPTAVIDGNGKTTATAYDSDGRVSSVTDRDSHITTTAYDADGEVTLVTNALSHTTYYAYDADGHNTVVIDGRGDITTMSYDAGGELTGSVDGVGRTTFSYDLAGRQTNSEDYNKGRTITVYDADGEILESIKPDGGMATFQYDGDGRVTSQTDYLGNTSGTVIDAAGEIVATVDPLGHRTTTMFDLDGRATATIDALGNRTTTMYDAAGRVTTVIDADSNRTTFAYDAVGNKTQMTDPLGHSATFAYDAANQLTSTTDRNSQKVTYTYDNDGRETGETWYNSGGTVTNRVTFTYDNQGNLLTAANTNGAYTMAYDAINETTAVNEPVGVTLTMIYDNVGNRTEVQDGTGKEDSTYDAENRLTKRVYTQGTSTEVAAVSMAYDALNEMTSINRLYGTSETTAGASSLSYDDDMRLVTLQHTAGTYTYNYTYTYDAASNVQTETRNSTAVTYTYDADNQLVSQITGSGTTTFTYDGTGNRNSTVNSGTTVTYSTTTGNEMTTDGTYTYTYDNNGNEIGKRKISNGDYWTYSYDDKNEMISAVDQTSGHTIETSAVYKYDAFGNRIESDVTQSGTTNTTKFVQDGWDPALAGSIGNSRWNVAEDYLNGSLKTRYVRGDVVDQLFAELAYSGSSFTPNWTLTDRLGSVRDIVNNAGTSQDSITYNAFGQITSETNSANRGRYAWSGRELDVETGLQYNRARFYDSNTGRWLGQDPLGFSAGDSNLYRYVHNQPTDATDPSGLLDVNLTDAWNALLSQGKTPIKGGSIIYLPGSDLEFVNKKDYVLAVSAGANIYGYPAKGNKVVVRNSGIYISALSDCKFKDWKFKQFGTTTAAFIAQSGMQLKLDRKGADEFFADATFTKDKFPYGKKFTDGDPFYNGQNGNFNLTINNKQYCYGYMWDEPNIGVDYLKKIKQVLENVPMNNWVGMVFYTNFETFWTAINPGGKRVTVGSIQWQSTQGFILNTAKGTGVDKQNLDLQPHIDRASIKTG